MKTEYIKHRKSIYNSITTLKGIVKDMANSSFLSKEEKQAALKVVEAFEALRAEYCKIHINELNENI